MSSGILFFLLFLLGISVGVLLLIERAARTFFPGRVPFWRRIWIPVPMVIFLLGNYADVSCAVRRDVLRYPENLDGTGNALFYAGLIAVLVLPATIARGTRGARRFSDSFGFCRGVRIVRALDPVPACFCHAGNWHASRELSAENRAVNPGNPATRGQLSPCRGPLAAYPEGIVFVFTPVPFQKSYREYPPEIPDRQRR